MSAGGPPQGTRPLGGTARSAARGKPATSGCDALVVGGGPAGATAALLLARAGLRVGVVEKAAFPRRKVCGEYISATTWPLLRSLGVADALSRIAGPPVRRVGVFAGRMLVSAPLPQPAQGNRIDGRAVGREHLDLALLQAAERAGASVWQPWTLTRYEATADEVHCEIAERGGSRSRTVRVSFVIAAHGAWETGVLPTQAFDCPPRAGDLLGFKAHFRNAALPPDLMPLFAFPGGYGGLVNSDGGRLSLSCCVRRDALAAARLRSPGERAGAALLALIRAHCDGVDAVLRPARLDDAWLAAGPLSTGMRGFGSARIIAIGNAAAEAHPIIAEGITMAIQSAYLACEALLAHDRTQPAGLDAALDAARRAYAAAWRRNFSLRLHAAAVFAHLFMRPVTAAAAAGVLRVMPGLLTLGARFSGKDALLRGNELRLVSESRR